MATLMVSPKIQFLDNNGNPLVGGKLYTYSAGTLDNKLTWTTASQAVENTNPVILNSRGEADVFLSGSYKFILTTSDDVEIWSVDNITQTNDASSLTVIAAVSNAVSLRLDEFMAANLSLLHFGVNTSSSSSSITTALNTAINSASAVKNKLKIPGGTWTITPATNQVWEGAGNMLCGMLLKNDLWLKGESNTVIKIANGISSDSSPTQMAMFFTNSQLSNIRFENLILDMNGTNNPISPNRGTGVYNRFNQAHIHVSGTVDGVAARIDGAVVKGCKLINSPGVTCIGMAQSNTSGITLGKYWKIIENTFENNGIDTDDHSSIFGWAEYVQIGGNIAKNSTMYDGKGANVFYECHGAWQEICDNIVENYNQFSWCATNNTNTTENVIYSNNLAKVREIGTGFYRLTTSTALLKKIKIRGDIYNLTDDSTAAPVKYGVLLSGGFADAAVTDIDIEDVLTTKTGVNYPSAAVGIGSAANIAGQKHSRIRVKRCGSIGTNFGVLINTNATNGLGEIEVTGGNYQTAPTSTYTQGIGIYVNLSGSNTIDTLTIGEDHFDGSNNGMHRGIYLEQGTITDLHLRPCTYQGMITSDYSEGSVTITRRHGYFPQMSYTPVFSFGTPITLGNGTIIGKYVKNGQLVTVDVKLIIGSTTVIPVGNLSFTLPIDSISSGTTYLGQCRLADSSDSNKRYQGQLSIDGTGASASLERDTALYSLGPSAGAIFFTDDHPITIAAGDEITASISYNVSY